jgi:RNHCP domain-containing protein
MTFIRNKEDFVCEHCGTEVKGSGYTNHCPHCLWSKHVDVEPGDRAEMCGGLMEPMILEGSTPHYRIVHVCKRCGVTRRVDVADTDESEAIIELSAKQAKKN